MRLVSICPSLRDLLENATTEKGQDRYADVLEKVREHCMSLQMDSRSIRFKGYFFCSRTSHSRCLRPHPRLESLPRIKHPPAQQMYYKIGSRHSSSCNATSYYSAEIPGTFRRTKVISPASLDPIYLDAIFYKFVEKLDTGHIPIRATDFPTFLCPELC